MNINPMIEQPKGFPPLPSGWLSETETFPSHSGAVQMSALVLRKEPWAGPRLLLVIHGMGEHSGRYRHVPYYLANDLDAVYIPDLQGHGRSGGIRGHIERFDDLIDDLAMIVRQLDARLRNRFGKSEIHVLGHSLGGHLLLRLLLLYPDLPIQSATASAPFLGIKDPVPAAKKAAVQVLAKFCKSVKLNTGLDVRALSRDQEVCKNYLKDPLNHPKMTPAFFRELLWAFGDTLRRDKGIQVPLQLLIPLADRIVDAECAFRFFNNLELPEKRIKTYPGFYHEPLNEIGKEQVFDDLRSWIQEHSNG